MGRGTVHPGHVCLALAALMVLLIGCQGPRENGSLRDPLEPINRVTFGFNRTVHFLVIDPVTGVYRKVTPDPVERGVSNFFNNISYPHVIVNDLLQFEFGRALQSTGRLAVNTTLGVGGLFDPATDMGLPAREQSFGVTAWKWGLEPGPYLVLPLLGPSTTSALPDVPLRIFTNPIFYLDAGLVQSTLSGTGAVDRAAANEQRLDRVEQAVNPYVFLREAYWQHQRSLLRAGSDDAAVFEAIDLPEDAESTKGAEAESTHGEGAESTQETDADSTEPTPADTNADSDSDSHSDSHSDSDSSSHDAAQP